MKTLFINRHAKSSWDDSSLKDFDRPLNSRGNRDAPIMADRFVEKEKKVDQIVSSPAKRAFQTAKYFSKVLQGQDIYTVDEIYEATTRSLLHIINDFSDDYETIIIFGHNPGFSSLVDYLCDQNIYLPTCGIVKIRFNVDSWSRISAESGELVYFDFPKNESN